MIECKELDRLNGESSRLFAEFKALEDDVKMTSKRDPAYAEKTNHLRKVQGQLRESHKRSQQHIKDHGCR